MNSCKCTDCKCKQPGKTLDVQIGGQHYKHYGIQPAEFAFKNKLSWHQGEIIKYILRYKDKNGEADLLKAKHLLEMLVEFEYGND